MLAIYGCRQGGAGHEHLKNLCYFLNMPEHVLSNNDQNILLNLKESAKRVAEKGMSMAASKLRGTVDRANVGVSVDGTWQHKGFTSLNGVITTISIDSGKVLDTAILSQSCKSCTIMKKRQKIH